MDTGNRATILWGDFFKLNRPQIRAFHMSWFAFFLCFFAWFGIAPLMKIVREELQLTQEQVGWCIIASVSITVLARLLVGWLCDRIGPRIAYTWLLVLGSLPVMGIGLAHDYTTFLVFRLMIGAIGASFVITQYHTSIMFAPNCVGTANATSAGWGNLGGGVTQMVMPLIFALFVGIFGFSEQISWRVAMLAAGALCMLTGVAYYFLTQDTPEGNFKQLRAEGRLPAPAKANGAFLAAIKDYRVWALFVAYAACFGIELTINNVAALYFLDYFDYLKNMDTVQAVKMAGLFAGLFGLMNIFARTLGGVLAIGLAANGD
jgi:NNP family nitrate/nitrite transporter-like MFS transporter